MFFIELNRVCIREFVWSDLNDLYEICKNPNVGPNAGWKEHKSIQETRTILNKFIKEKETFAIVDKANNKCIGSIGVYKDYKRENPNCRMIGYVLNELYWGKGIMSETLKGLIDFIFKNTNIMLLSIYHFPFNLKSKRVIEKCGFKYEGVLKNATLLFDGLVYDDVCYSLSKKEYIDEQEKILFTNKGLYNYKKT